METRNCKQYIVVNNVCSGPDASLNASNIVFNFEYENTPPEINDIVNQVANAHWEAFKRIFDAGIDKLVEETVESIVSPMFNEGAIQDVFFMKEKC